MPKHERHDLIQRCGAHRRNGAGPVGNGSLFHGTVHRNAPLSQALREHQRGLASRLRAQNGICAERIGIRRISTVPVSPAIHGHGCGRRVVHVVRIEFGDAVGPTVVAEQGIIVDERHGSDAPLPQRLGRVCRKRSQPGTPIDMRRIRFADAEQHVAIAFEHQSRSAIFALLQIGLRLQRRPHVERGRSRIRRQRFHGGRRRIRRVEILLGHHIASRVGDGDGVFTAKIGGSRLKLADQSLCRNGIHGFRSVKPSDHRRGRNGIARRFGRGMLDFLQCENTRQLVENVGHDIADAQHCGERHGKRHSDVSTAFHRPVFSRIIHGTTTLQS